MINWNMTTPSRLISGKGSVSFLPELIREMGIKRPFLIIDPMVQKSNFGERLLNILDLHHEQNFSGFGTNPTFPQVNEGLSLFNDGKHDSIVVAGGGSAIDLAKVIGLAAANGGKAEDYFHGKEINAKPLPLIAIPTTCGTGAESSPFAVIMDQDAPKKKGIENVFLMPTAVILDPESLVSLDKVMIAATGMDALTHILESHISRKATALTRIISKGLLYSIREPLEKAVSEKNPLSLEILQSIAFTARLLYPRTGLSIAHALSHPLGAFTNMHHGLAVILFLEASMKYNLPACEIFFKEAEDVMGFSAQHGSLLSWIEKVIQDAGIADEVGRFLRNYPNLPVEKIATEALKSSNIPSNPRDLGLNEAVKIVKESLAKFRRL